jgi:simple sugar transport system ATP-binding protein
VTTRNATTSRSIVLALRGITKRFGSTLALDDAALNVRHGTIHALLGENGAGKTTLMRIAFGLIQADDGSIEVAGVSRRITSAADAIAAGLGMVHQHFTNVGAMTVAENVALGGRGRLDRRDAIRRVEDIGARTGLRLEPEARADQLTVSAQQRLEIVKALARDARILILDEPTAVLAPTEADDLLRWLREFADAGNSVVLITHKLREALSVADDVTVLRRGRVVQHAASRSLTVESLASAMLGEEPVAIEQRTDNRLAGEDIVTAVDTGLVDERGSSVVRSATFTIRGGDIVGLAAVEGSGQRELLRMLSGRRSPVRGQLRLPKTIGFVPEDRHRDALVLDFPAPENIALNGAGARQGRMHWQDIRAATRALISAYDVRGAASDQPVSTLSGGNQQKLVLARELGDAPALLVVENPTRGLDIRATREVHARLRDVAASGAAVVVYSSDLDEVLALATRVFVLHGGEVREYSRDREIVGRAMLGVG